MNTLKSAYVNCAVHWIGLLLVCASTCAAALPTVYPYDLAPATYPDYRRRLQPVPDWNAFHNQPQFVGTRYATMDENYFTTRWQQYNLIFVPTNSGTATLQIANQNCDATVLVDDVSFQAVAMNEMLVNGSCEGTGGWSLGSGANYTNSQSHSATHSICLQPGSAVNASPAPSIQAGHTYQCSVWVKATNSGPWVIVLGNWLAGGSDLWVSRATVNNDWEHFTATITPTNLTGNYNQFEVSSESGGPTLYVDDFSVMDVTSGTNHLTNSNFESTNSSQGWLMTSGVNVYQDGHASHQSMLVRNGHNMQTTTSVVSGQTYQATLWLSVAGRSQGQVLVSLGGAGVGFTNLVVTNETTDNPSGLVYWPQVQLIVNSGGITSDLIGAWTNHGVILHDPGGYGPGDPWVPNYGQCLVNTNSFAMLTNQLGNRFTGGDIGEQDARFANVFETCYEPFSQTNRFLDFKAANRYQGQCADDFGDVTSLLSELWLWHYPVKDGNVMTAGAEAQPKNGIANSQVQYSFIRGAGKQYGVPWWGNVSIFSTDWLNNGINYKSYPTAATNGNSLSLMRRMLFSHYLYGSRILSFEGSERTDSDTVSPIGMVHEAMVQTINQYGIPGVMHAPAGLLLDYWSGWMPAQYNRGDYYVWNGLDYDLGDFLTHDVFSLIYPNYEANGFFQNETGGMCNTPYGDMADTLLSDVTAPILNRYGVVIATSNLRSADTELRDKVENFVTNGGNFIVTGENARRLWPEFGISSSTVTISAGGSVTWSDSTTNNETYSGALYTLTNNALPSGYSVLASYSGSPAVIDIPRGAGVITLLLSPYGLNQSALTSVHPSSSYNVALAKPYVLMNHVQKILTNRLAAQRLFSVGNTNLGYITCRRGAGDYLVGVLNNNLTSQTFGITSLIGTITNLTELDLGASMTNALGYWPLGYETNNGGASDSSHVFGGDIRLFRVQVAETNSVRLLGSNLPPARPFNRMIAVPALSDLKDTIQHWFTFFDHFDGVKLDWTSVRNADLTVGGSALLYEPMQWLARHQVRFITDFSSGFVSGNLTLNTNATGTNYTQSVAQFDSAMSKLALLGRANDIIVSAEELSSTNVSAFRAGVGALCADASSRGINVHFKHRTTSWTPDVASTLTFIRSVGAANLDFAANTADAPSSVGGLLSQAGNKLGLILIVPTTNGAAMDLTSLHGSSVIQILDAGYGSWDSVYRDTCAAWVTNGAALMAGTNLTTPPEIYWGTSTNNVQRYWTARDTVDLPNTLRQMTSFWSYFGGVKMDYKYLAYRDASQCAADGQWLQARNVQLIVDFSSDLNNYPGMTLADSTRPGDGLDANYQRSMATINDAFNKMQLMGVTNCIIRPTMPNNSTNLAAYQAICTNAWAHGHIMIHMQHCVGNWITRNQGSYEQPANVAALIDAIAAPNGNLKMAVNGCHVSNLASAITTAGSRLGLILMGYPAATRVDVDVHGEARLGMSTSAISGKTVPMILDSEYTDWNDTAQDLSYLSWAASTPFGPPLAPTGVFATARSGCVAVGWNAVSGATGFFLKCSTTSGGAYVTVTNVASTNVLNIGLTNGTTYYFVVTGTNSYGESPSSAEVSATPSISYLTNLFWSGAVNGTWDASSANWWSNGVSAKFANGCAVVFDDSALGNTTVNLSGTCAPASVIVNNSVNDFTISGSAIAGAGGLSKFGSRNLTLTGANTYSGPMTLVAGSLIIGGAGQLGGGIYATSIVNNALFDYASSATQTYSGIMSGTGSLTLSGTGILTLSSNNTYNGSTVINSGKLALTGSGSISNSSGISISNGAILDVSGLTNPFVLQSSQTLSNSASSTGNLNGNLLATNGIVSVSYASAMPAFAITNGTFTLASATTFKINNKGAQLGLGNYKIISTKAGGTVAVSDALPLIAVAGNGVVAGASNSLSISNGELYLVVALGISTNWFVGAAGAQWTDSASWSSGTVPNSIGAVVNFTNANNYPACDGSSAANPFMFGTMNITNLGAFASGPSYSSANNLFANPAGQTGSPVINVGNAFYAYFTLYGTNGFTKTGPGTLNFRYNGVTQMFTGAVVVANGTLGIQADYSLGWTNNRVILSNGVAFADYNSSSSPVTLSPSRAITLAGGTNITLTTWSSAYVWGIPCVINEAPTNSGCGFIWSGAGELILSNANTFTGTLKMSAGTNDIAHQNAVQYGTLQNSGGVLLFDSGVSGNAFTFGGLAGTNGFSLQNNAGTPAPVILTVGGNNASTTYFGKLSGTGSLVKTGNGTLTLTSSNAYSGQTTVNNGELVVSTAFVGGGNVLVNSGAAFGVTNSASAVALVSNITVSAGSKLEFQNVTNTSQPLLSARNVNIGGNCTVIINGAGGLVGGKGYPLINYAGVFSGSMTNFQLLMPNGWRAALANVGNQIVLTNVAVVSTVSPKISTTMSGPQIQLAWPSTNTGWRLQTQTNSLTVGLGPNWTDVPPTVWTNQITMPIATTNGCVFYRLIYP